MMVTLFKVVAVLAAVASFAEGFSTIGASGTSTCTLAEGECTPLKQKQQTSPLETPQDQSSSSCPAPDAALQALAGANHLRACVVCPLIPGVRRSAPPTEALADAPWHTIAFRNDASEPTKITYVDEYGKDGNFEWVQPGQRAAFFTTAGSWWRAYSMSGEVLLEHRVGLRPIVKSDEVILSNGGRRLRHVSFPAHVTEQWKREINRPLYNATGDAVTVGFINLAGFGVDIVWAADDREEELVAQIVTRQVEYQLSYAGHKFELRDEAGKPLHVETIEDVIVHDCSQASRSAVAAREPMRLRIRTSTAPKVSQAIGGMSL